MTIIYKSEMHTVFIFSFLFFFLIYFSDLLQLITQSSNPNPKSVLLTSVWDFKSWMEPYLGLIGGHSKYLVFRFTLGSFGKAELHYKQFSTMPWEPEGTGVHVLSVSSNMETIIMKCTHVHVCILYIPNFKFCMHIGSSRYHGFPYTCPT